MSGFSVYHVRVRADGELLTVGVCAASKTDGAACVVRRLKADGYREVGIDTAGRVSSAGSWEPGNVLIY